MFKSLELIVHQVIDLDLVLNNLISLGYRKSHKTLQEGDLSQRGGVLDIFPSGFDSPVRIDFDDDKIRAIASVNPESGKFVWQHKIIIILPHKTSSKTIFHSDIPLNNFVDIQKNDYVVHNYHGIGKFLGIEEVEINHEKREHLIIEYQGGDKLFVPKHDLRLVQKYISFHKKPPRVYKLGSKEWSRVKAQIQKRLEKLAAELLHIQALRASMVALSPTSWNQEASASMAVAG